MTESYNRIKQLIQHFKEQETAYLSPGYQESQVRQDFIDKFFTALGWDVTHEVQKNPYEQEVKIENKVNTSGSQRRADYAFFASPNYRDVKFFVEAKKPSRNLANPNDYYQTIRYGWNSKTPIAVLTDFEEFHILDCRFKPDIKTALDRKLEVFHYSDFEDEEKFKRIFYLFSRDEVANGSINKFAAALPKPRAKAERKGMFKAVYKPVDEAFLESLDGYREQLARAFKNKNQNLEGEELTEAVQRTIDRLVFIRFLEDKSIEEPFIVTLSEVVDGTKGLLSTQKGDSSPRQKASGLRMTANEGIAWKKFSAHCRSLEPKYNGLVFKPHRIIDSPDFNPPDDKMFAEICGELADPTSPYDFDKIPISILGSIYERFLGKVVSTTEKRAKVIEKPEVRKAGGVYYTPEYIVRYIVNETVGKLLYEEQKVIANEVKQSDSSPTNEIASIVPQAELPRNDYMGKKIKLTPKQVEDLKIIDIACGSGSFLIEVYNQLLDYHTKYYNEYPEKAKKGDVETREGKIVLSLKKRQEILTNNVYGVDIDFQATEVTQLSLYLKLLEDVTMNDAFQYSLLKEKILPDLRNNIVCGNSLIGTDILEGKLFDSEEERKLNPMNFEDAFPQIFSPLERGRRGVSDVGFDAVVGNPPYLSMEDMNSIHRDYYYEKVDSKRNRYLTAIHKSNLYAMFYEKAIFLTKQKGFVGMITPHSWLSNSSFINLRKLFLDNTSVKSLHIFPVGVFQDAGIATGIVILNILTVSSNAAVKVFDLRKYTIKDLPELLNKPKLQNEIPLMVFKNSNELVFNIQWNKKESSILEKINSHEHTLEDYVFVDRGCDTANNEKFTGFDFKKTYNSKRLMTGQRFGRYWFEWDGLYLYYLPDEMKKDKETARPGQPERFESNEKLIVYRFLDNDKKLQCTYDNEQYYCLGSCYIINKKDNIYINLKFILAILDSCLIGYYNGKLFSGIKVTRNEMLRIPIPEINFQNKIEKAAHDKIVQLVEQMLAAKEKLNKAKLDSEVNKLEMQIASLDRKIDEAVYELYGLMEEEIRIVERNK
jgi:type I restriction-modification system DNA methylase subunit